MVFVFCGLHCTVMTEPLLLVWQLHCGFQLIYECLSFSP
uniref:Uncharacterized protein n=1 Tax=Anguilla anguilla TaxID=7936 RepID=A0A0E9RDT6_ANGAN